MFVVCCFFFNDTATTEIYTLSLHDALPILGALAATVGFIVAGFFEYNFGDSEIAMMMYFLMGCVIVVWQQNKTLVEAPGSGDRKSTRLNSSHKPISYAVFCLKKKKHTALIKNPPTQ